jgi:hypothetical protein
MLKLSERYGDKPAAEFPMLFQRILQNTISTTFDGRSSKHLGHAFFGVHAG